MLTEGAELAFIINMNGPLRREGFRGKLTDVNQGTHIVS
jgi:hypothetical protein